VDLKKLSALCDLLLEAACKELLTHPTDQKEIVVNSVNQKRTTPSGDALEVVRMAVDLSTELIRLEAVRIQSGVALNQVKP